MDNVDIKSSLGRLEMAHSKDVSHLREDVSTIKQDLKGVKKDIDQVKSILLRNQGMFETFRVFLPYALAVLGVLISIVVYVGFEQRIEQEREIKGSIQEHSKRIEGLYSILGRGDGKD